MVFKLVIVILTLLVINNGAQRFNGFDIDPNNFYKYNFLKHLSLKRDGETETNDVTTQKNHAFCHPYYKKCNKLPVLPRKNSLKRALMDYQDFSRSMAPEIMTDEYEDNIIEK
ncbi:uncharacterized protein LOC133530900 [Cydia pomonella]|uniref:uncharacterized protein LOC133530900 n=1 Tax=Cydia pomonella TaxID=82600 RepID=UPI002ADE0B76|nr:uncharacterized protein LOC133530900 [Cydia pomonella]